MNNEQNTDTAVNGGSVLNDGLDISSAYNALVEIARLIPEKPAEGIGGMWTPDSQHISDDLIFRTYHGGYEHHLMSPKFKFKIIEGYTDTDGSTVRLVEGTHNAVEKCLAHFGVSNAELSRPLERSGSGSA